LYDRVRDALLVASVGDSICVLGTRDRRAVALAAMHRVDNASERRRVESAGGVVINNRYVAVHTDRHVLTYVLTDRVNGILAVTRAFGDIQFKKRASLSEGARGAGGGLTGHVVSAEPEISITEKVSRFSRFAILASDGLWDVMTPQMVISFVTRQLNKKIDHLEITRNLIQKALSRGSIDNITVTLITFHG
jgi:serine/threonine protein phosphatase PrpC